MSTKLEKLGADLMRAREKAQEWSKKAEELEQKYKEQENLEICEISRTYKLTPEKLMKLLSLTGNGLPDPDLAASFCKEDEGHE